jgi:beta-glucosidase
VADVLFGDAGPAGRLPFTMYRATADLPPFDDYAMRGRTYRYFEREPLYPFGHGLAYTRFRYANPSLSLSRAHGGTVAVDVENAGARGSDDVVQVYVIPGARKPYAPRRWLAAFARVTLAAGEKRTVRLSLPPRALTLVDANGERHLLTGQVTIAVGGGQPDAAGHYPDDTRGVATPIDLGDGAVPR